MLVCPIYFDCGFGINQLHLVSECYYTRRSETPLHRCALLTSIGHPRLNMSAYASRCLGVVRARTIDGCRISANLGWSAPITRKAVGQRSQSEQVKVGHSTNTSFHMSQTYIQPHASLKLRLPALTAVSEFLVKLLNGFPQNFLI